MEDNLDGDIAHQLAKRDAGHKWVDLCDPADSQICVKMRNQDELRDHIFARVNRYIDAKAADKTVYLECSDSGDCAINSRDSNLPLPSVTTNRLMQISKDVQKVIETGNAKTTLNGSVLSLLVSISGYNQTFDPPMLEARDKNNYYWETASRPFEKGLIDELRTSTGTITQADLMKTALEVCGKDTQLAILTLANFTKNMAAIERRQVKEAEIDPSLRELYSEANIDAIFHRIEGFADDPNVKYNKEGAMYHFWGALLAGSQIGPVTKGLVMYDNFVLSTEAESWKATDPIKDAAGLAGAGPGDSFWLWQKWLNSSAW